MKNEAFLCPYTADLDIEDVWYVNTSLCRCFVAFIMSVKRATQFPEFTLQFYLVTGEIVICDDFGGIDTDKDDKITVKEMKVSGTFHQSITTMLALVKQLIKQPSSSFK